MPPALPPPELTIPRQQARRFLLTHLRLLPPRKLRGEQGVLDFVRHVTGIRQERAGSRGSIYSPAESAVPGAKHRAIQTLLTVAWDLDDDDLRMVLDLACHLVNRGKQ